MRWPVPALLIRLVTSSLGLPAKLGRGASHAEGPGAADGLPQPCDRARNALCFCKNLFIFIKCALCRKFEMYKRVSQGRAPQRQALLRRVGVWGVGGVPAQASLAGTWL